MKLNFLKFALLSIILVAGSSCVKDNVDNIENFNGKTASFQLAQSRLTLDGTTFAFETGDKVGICFNNGIDLNLEGTVTVNGDVATVDFTYSGNIEGEQMLVYHPYSAANNGKAFGSLQITVSPRQTQAADGSFDCSNLPLLSEMVGYNGSETNVVLTSHGAIIKFNVYGNAAEKVKNVSIATDAYAKVFSSGVATLNAGKHALVATDNGVDVTLATPTYSGASKANGAIAYATVFGFGAGERTYNAYVAVTTDKALYTWTRNITCAKGTGTTINLNLATADDAYPVKTYTTTATGRLAKVLYNANNEREYVMGERTWMTANLRWRGYTGDLGTASEDATYAQQFGTYYNYYEAASTVKNADSNIAYAAPAILKYAVEEDRLGNDEMGLNLNYTYFTTGYDHNGNATNKTKNLNVPLNPTSNDGKTLRGQWQFVCPKGWHLSNYTDWYHLVIAVSDTYARGTSWSNGEVGFSGDCFDYSNKDATSPKNPFCNVALACRVNDATTAPINLGLIMSGTIYCNTPTEPNNWAERGKSFGIMIAGWLRAGVNQKHDGPWADHLTDDTENGWWYKYNSTYTHVPLFVTTDSYTAIKTAKGTCNPATYLVNAGYGTDKVGAEYVGFNAYPAGAASFVSSSSNYCKYASFLQPMTIKAKGNQGTTATVQLDYNRADLRMIQKPRTNGTSNQYAVRCVKNYEHYDLK